METYELDLNNIECVLEEDFKQFSHWIAPDLKEEYSVKVLIEEGKDSFTKRIQFHNRGVDTIFFYSSVDKYFMSSLNSLLLLPEEQAKGSLWIEFSESHLKFEECVSSKNYSVKRMNDEGKQFLLFALINGGKILPGKSCEIEVVFDKNGMYQFVLEFNPREGEEDTVWGFSSIGTLYSEEFVID